MPPAIVIIKYTGSPFAFKYWWGSVYQLGKGEKKNRGKEEKGEKMKRVKNNRGKEEKEKRRIGE